MVCSPNPWNSWHPKFFGQIVWSHGFNFSYFEALKKYESQQKVGLFTFESAWLREHNKNIIIIFTFPPQPECTFFSCSFQHRCKDFNLAPSQWMHVRIECILTICPRTVGVDLLSRFWVQNFSCITGIFSWVANVHSLCFSFSSRVVFLHISSEALSGCFLIWFPVRICGNENQLTPSHPFSSMN